MNQATKKTPIMGCYGLGIDRLMGTVAEVLADDKGLVWPAALAPFHLHIVPIFKDKKDEEKHALALYEELIKSGAEVLYDDREMSPGEKFADADLLGLPYRLVISDKTIGEGKMELKDRRTGETEMVTAAELSERLARLKKYD